MGMYVYGPGGELSHVEFQRASTGGGGPHSGPHVARAEGSLTRRGGEEQPGEEFKNGNNGGEEGGANNPKQ
jgi:hypothetical protein